MAKDPAIVVLRGLAREAGHSQAFVRALQSRSPIHKIECVDLPGAGALFALTSANTIPAIATQLNATLQAHDSVYLVGQSMGAMIAMALMESNALQIRGMTLINTSLRQFSRFSERLRPSQWWNFLCCTLRWQNVAWRESRIAAIVNNHPLNQQQLNDLIAMQMLHPVSRTTLLAQTRAAASFCGPRHLTVPVQLLCSEHDRLVNPICSQRLAAQWHASLYSHHDAGHDLLAEAADWCADHVLAHLSQLEIVGKK